MASVYLQQLLVELGFERTPLPLSFPLIIFGTAGSGKTTIQAALAKHFPELRFSSFHPIVLEPNTRKRQTLASFSEETDVLDEFLAGPNPTTTLAKFCDPLQYNCHDIPAPHYQSFQTYRFCPKTCALLNSLFKTTLKSKKEVDSSITFPDAWNSDPTGIVVAPEPTVQKILTLHRCPIATEDELVGKTITRISLYCNDLSDLIREDPAAAFIALTRHTEALEIFELDL